MEAVEDLDIDSLAFEFFKKFARFEFAMKRVGFLRNEEQGRNAEVGWDKFQNALRGDYRPSKAAIKLITLHPKKQIVGADKKLTWVEREFSGEAELDKVIVLLKTVRNNLFHGGKCVDGAEWDDRQRMESLLSAASIVLDELARFASSKKTTFDNSYSGKY